MSNEPAMTTAQKAALLGVTPTALGQWGKKGCDTTGTVEEIQRWRENNLRPRHGGPVSAPSVLEHRQEIGLAFSLLNEALDKLHHAIEQNKPGRKLLVELMRELATYFSQSLWTRVCDHDPAIPYLDDWNEDQKLFEAALRQRAR